MFPMGKGKNKVGDLEFEENCCVILDQAFLQSIWDDFETTMYRFIGYTEMDHMSLHF